MSKTMSWFRYLSVGVVMILVSVLFLVWMLPLLPWRHLRVRSCNAYGKIAGRLMFTAIGAKPVIHNLHNLHAQHHIINRVQKVKFVIMFNVKRVIIFRKHLRQNVRCKYYLSII